jgi:hypothetical protein
VEGVEVEADVVDHADAAKALAHVLALRPQHHQGQSYCWVPDAQAPD